MDFTGFSPDVPSVSYDVENMKSRAISAALSYIDKSPYAFGEDIGEVRETIKFLRNPLSSLFDLSTAFRQAVRGRLKGRTIAKFLLRKEFAAIWLQYRFAFLPLVRSIGDLIEARQKELKRPLFRTARGFDKYEQSETLQSVNAGTHEVDTYNVFRAHSAIARAYIHYRKDSPIVDWRYRYGLRFKDIPETMWQLCPYSFMVDRVINISNTIGGLTNLSDPSIEIVAAGVVMKIDDVVATHLISAIDDRYSCSTDGDTIYDRNFSYVREIVNPSLSDVVAKPDISGLVSDATKTVDLIALILQNMRL
jgi:hypothetical protein